MDVRVVDQSSASFAARAPIRDWVRLQALLMVDSMGLALPLSLTWSSLRLGAQSSMRAGSFGILVFRG
jgi:hypothetical protein